MNGSVAEKETKMQRITNEISKEKYDKLKGMTYAEQEKEIFPNGIPDAWQWGYGYYGHAIYEKDGKYYETYSIGSSCD